ncbi:putative BOI-related E3 ubiquitin-protein ligase 3 [Capsicum chacoense]
MRGKSCRGGTGWLQCDEAVPVDAKNKRMMKEVVTEEPSSAAVSQQQRRTMPMNFFPHQPQPHLQQLRQSPFSFNFSSQQQQRPTDQPENLDGFLTRPFTSYTALLTEEDDCVPGPLRRMYDHIDQITKSHSGEVRNMLFDVYRRYYNSLISTVNQEAEKKLIEKEEELRQAKMKIVDMEQTIRQLTYQGRHLQTRIKNLDMRSAAQEARLCAAAQAEAAQQHESAESSYFDPNRVDPVAPCRACFKAEAAVIIFPCRHLCVCASCAATVNVCPVCLTPKCATHEVVFP